MPLQTPLLLKGPRSQSSSQRRDEGFSLIVHNLTCLQTPWKVLLGLLGVAALVTIITVPVVLLNKGRQLATSFYKSSSDWSWGQVTCGHAKWAYLIGGLDQCIPAIGLTRFQTPSLLLGAPMFRL